MVHIRILKLTIAHTLIVIQLSASFNFLKSHISNLYQDCSRIEYAWMQFQRDIKETHDRSICSYMPRIFLAAPFREIRLDFTERSYYSRKLVLANARSGKTVPTRGSRAGPTTHPHSRIKHKCHLLCLILTSREHLLFLFFLVFSFLSFSLSSGFLSRRSSFSRFETPVVADSRTCFCCQLSYSFTSPSVLSRISFLG